MGAQMLLQQGSGRRGEPTEYSHDPTSGLSARHRVRSPGMATQDLIPGGLSRKEVHVMRRVLMFSAASLLLVACADATAPLPVAEGSTAPPIETVDELKVGVYGALIPELVSSEGMEWRRVYVVTSLCTDPTELVGDDATDCGDVLSEAEQHALRERLDVEDLRFIDDPTTLYDDDWFQGPPNEVVVTLGPIVERAGDIRVGASYGCGGRCGSGNTWVLEERNGQWAVVRTRGPGWIA